MFGFSFLGDFTRGFNGRKSSKRYSAGVVFDTLEERRLLSSITIQNFGFENPVLSDNNYTTNSVPGWTITPGSGSDGGVWNATAGHFSPQAPEGSNIVYLETPSSSSTDAVLAQVLSENLAANTHYELKVEVGYPNTTAGKGYKIQLLAGGVVLAEDDNSVALTQGGWKTASLTFNTSANPSQLGQALEIRLIAKASSGAYKQVEFDNVRLDAQPILPDPDPDPALVGWWRLNEGGGSTAFDASNYNNDGVIGGRAQWGEGHEREALYFDGYNDLVDLGNSSSLDLSGKVTLSAWIKPQATDGLRTIIAHGYRIAPSGEVTLRIAETEEGPVYVVGTWGDGDPHGADMPMPLTDIGQWVHITGLYDGTAWKIYRNGVLGLSRADSVGALPVDASWSIGSSGGIGERMFQGSIDDVRLYNYGLSDTEVEELYENSSVGLPAELTAMALSESSVGLNWPEEAGDITGYTLQRAPHGGSFVTVESLDPLTTSYIDTGLDEGTTYDYKLITTFASDPSVEETATVTTQLLAPTDLSIASVGASALDLSWSGHPAAGRWFEVWRSTDNKIYSLVGAATAQTFSDTALEAGHRYYYKVRNRSAAVSSDFSNIVNHSFDRSVAGPNWGFENPTLGEDAWTTGGVPSWTINAPGGVSVGVWNPASARFPSGAAEGLNISYVETFSTVGESSISQVLGESLTAGKTYTLSVDVGYPTNAEAQGYKVQLLAGSTVLAEDDDILSLNLGAFRTSTVSYAVADNDPLIGSALEIRLIGKANTDNHHRQVEFDNVRLNAVDTSALTEVPEDPQDQEPPVASSVVAPQNLSASVASVHQINLSWSYSSVANGFRIYQSIDEGDTWNLAKDLNGGARSFTLGGLNPLNRYYFYVTASTSEGESSPSNLATAALLPDTPAGLTAEAQDTTTIVLQWNAVEGAGGYRIEQSPDGQDWEELEASITATTYTDASLDDGAHRYYRVSAYNTNGQSASGATVSATTDLNPPDNLSASAVSASEINLSWQDHSSAETAYVIERGTVSGSNYTFAYLTTVDANATHYSDIGLSADTQYMYRVRATSASAHSDYSNNASVKTHQSVEGHWESTGALATPPVTSDSRVSFGTFNPGVYRVRYVSGAIHFDVNTSNPKMWGVDVMVLFGDSGQSGYLEAYPYSSAAETEAAAEGLALEASHPGGEIKAYLVDSPYNDNAGSATWALDVWVPDDPGEPENPDPKPTVSIGVSTSNTTEGDTENPLVFTFTRSGQYSSALTAYYTLSGTAQPGVDYSPQSDFGTVYSISIPGGGSSASAQVQVNALADDLWEGDEPVKLSLRSNSSYWLGSSRSASGMIQDVAVNLAVDSNNNGVIGQSDEVIEDDATKPGKIISVNADDADSDGVPDWADGYGRFSDTPILENSSSTQFVPLTLTLSSGVDLSTATIQFDYEASDPLGVTRSGAGTQQDPYVYALPTTGGPMRLWTKTGGQSRDGASVGDGGDWIEPGQALNASDLFGTGRTVQLWVEAVKSSVELGDLRIEASVDPDGAESETSQEDAVRLTGISLQMAVDGNRDGIISYAGEDKTATNNPYRFWLNDDHDEANSDVSGGPLDGNDNKIKNTHDLEDFASLKVGYSPLLLDGLIDQISFRFTNAQENPSIRMWSVGGDLSYLSTYLTNEQTAQTIVNSYGDSPRFRRVFSDDYVMPWSTFANDFYASAENATLSTTPMLWEGVTKGAGQLTVSLIKNGHVFASSQINLDLKPIKQFYEAWTITDSSGTPAGNTATWPNPRDVGADPSVPITPIPSTIGLISDSSPASVEERANYSDDYILFVHGWRMTPEERRSFAETAYKRLFWQGFKGRFGLFSWPTEWVDTNNYVELLGTPAGRRNYDNGEMKAYASGAALRNLIKSLDQTGYSVNLYAHSMGNIVASEALREEAIGTNPQKIVHTYVASQAASAASAYDPNVMLDSNNMLTSYGISLQNTPDIYTNFSATGHAYFDQLYGVADKLYNFYNPQDGAVAAKLAWPTNQKQKPDIGGIPQLGPTQWQHLSYNYDGEDFIESASHLDWDALDNYWSPVVEWSKVLNLTSPYDAFSVMAYAAGAKSKALGATEGVGAGFTTAGQVDVSLDFSINNNFSDSRDDHSGQFNRDTNPSTIYLTFSC